MAITGTWWNELNSKMVIRRGKDRRQITGTYHTKVGKARTKKYPLVGRCDASGNPDQLVSWVVVWDPPDPPANPTDPPNKPSITAWTGQYHVGPGDRSRVHHDDVVAHQHELCGGRLDIDSHEHGCFLSQATLVEGGGDRTATGQGGEPLYGTGKREEKKIKGRDRGWKTERHA